MKKTLCKFTSFILLAFLTLNSCTQNVNNPVEMDEENTGSGTFKYNPDLDITFESFEQEGLEYFKTKNNEAGAVYSREASADSNASAATKPMDGSSEAFANAVSAFLLKKLNGLGTDLLNKGIQYLVTDIGGELLSAAGKSILKELIGEKTQIYRWLFPESHDSQDVYKQILALAESQVIMSAKLDKIYNAVVLTNLNSSLNNKKLQYNAIQLHDTKTSNLIESLRSSYEDVMKNGTDEEKAVAAEIINKQMEKILTAWGEEQVYGERHCANAMILMTNYMTKFICAPEPNMTYVEMYDFIASKIYGWEAEGYEMRELLRTLDKAVIIQDVSLAILYYNITGNSEYANSLQSKYDEFLTFCSANKVNFDYEHVICQIENVNKKFKSELGIKNSADYYDTLSTYKYSSAKEYRSRLNFKSWDVANRIRFGIQYDDPNWDSWKQPALLSMKDYQNIVNYYDNKLTLREIFQNHARFDKANYLLKNVGGREDKDGIHSFILNNANTRDWWDEDSSNWREYLYYSVTDMNSVTLPSQNSEWNEKYHSERDFKFCTNMVLELYDGARRNYADNVFPTGSAYVICWPVLDE